MSNKNPVAANRWSFALWRTGQANICTTDVEHLHLPVLLSNKSAPK